MPISLTRAVLVTETPQDYKHLTSLLHSTQPAGTDEEEGEGNRLFKALLQKETALTIGEQITVDIPDDEGRGQKTMSFTLHVLDAAPIAAGGVVGPETIIIASPPVKYMVDDEGPIGEGLGSDEEEEGEDLLGELCVAPTLPSSSPSPTTSTFSWMHQCGGRVKSVRITFTPTKKAKVSMSSHDASNLLGLIVPNETLLAQQQHPALATVFIKTLQRVIPVSVQGGETATEEGVLLLDVACPVEFRNLLLWAVDCRVDGLTTPLLDSGCSSFDIPIASSGLWNEDEVTKDGKAQLFTSRCYNKEQPLLPSFASLQSITLRPVCDATISTVVPPQEQQDESLRRILTHLSNTEALVNLGDLVAVPYVVVAGKSEEANQAAMVLDSAMPLAFGAVAEGVRIPRQPGCFFYKVEDVELAKNSALPAAGSVGGILNLTKSVPSGFTEVVVKDRPGNAFLPQHSTSSHSSDPTSSALQHMEGNAIESLKVYNRFWGQLKTVLSAGGSGPALQVLGLFGGCCTESGALAAVRHACEKAGIAVGSLDARTFIDGAAAADEGTLADAILLGVGGDVNPSKQETDDQYLRGGPAVVYVRHAHLLSPGGVVARLLLEHTSSRRATSHAAQQLYAPPPVVVLLFETEDHVNPALTSLATLEPIQITVPDEAEREELCGALLPFEASRRRCLTGNPHHGDVSDIPHPLADHLHVSFTLSPATLGGWCVGMTYSDIRAWLHTCVVDVVAAVQKNDQHVPSSPPVLSDADCEASLKSFQQAHGHNLTSTKLQPVRWSDVGGLEDAKRQIHETIQLPILHPELFAAEGVKKRAGILLYGPPGCGKTLLAKAVATEMSMNFISVKGPELINMYVGESEKNIRLLFQRARDASPCIVFFDEMDALAPSRGAKGDSGGVMDRIVAQLLAEVDGVGATKSDGSPSNVFIIAATNRPDLLDPSLLRPGRFDKLCYLGLPSTKAEQLFAVKALTRKFDMTPNVNLRDVVEPMDFVYTGADFFALCSDAMMMAVEEVLEVATQQAVAKQQAADEKGSADNDDEEEEESPPVLVDQRHFIAARDKLKPSVTPEELQKYLKLREQFEK